MVKTPTRLSNSHTHVLTNTYTSTFDCSSRVAAFGRLIKRIGISKFHEQGYKKILLTTNPHLSYTNNKYAMNEVFGMKTSFIAWFVFNSC
jgi:hypothetical protein